MRPPFRGIARTLVHRGVIPAEFLIGSPVDTNFIIRTGRANVRYRLTPGDEFGSMLYWKSVAHWEPNVIPLFLEWIEGASRFIDVGAHTGIYTLLACGVNAKCEAMCLSPFCRPLPV